MAVGALNSAISLADLAVELERVGGRVQGDGAVQVQDVRQDSRRVRVGDLFAARVGATSDGTRYIPDAIARGAQALLLERGAGSGSVDVPVVEVDDLRLGIALAAEAVHGHPSRRLDVVGITGTNGKTTIAWLVEHALSGAGHLTGRLGTLGYSCGSDRVESSLTTPEADVVSRYLAQAQRAGASHFVLEASSHALSQARVDAVHFAVAVFTNLTQDHLDFHGDMTAYAQAKRRLFTELEPRSSVVNVDDPFGARLAAELDAPPIRVSRRPDADVYPLRCAGGPAGVDGILVTPRGEIPFVSRLVGDHNLDNLLSVVGIACALDLEVGPVVEALEQAPSVPGRLERCDGPDDDIIVLVDYAHTPDALQRALAAVRGLTDRDLVCVFGCGGDRDPDKRPKMGDAVGRAATRAIISNDNPRTEDPVRIAEMIEPAVKACGIPYEVVLDRALAIERAVFSARPGDVVLIAGKGHEDYQIIGTTKRSFDDRVEARRALSRRREGGA
jgi:UDP-N-acetylmuramoyl-L-alanyl-D-glutamate--2,6-diaminopimelate ligase